MNINLISLCSGYDSQALALDRIKESHPDFDFKIIAWSEFDPESNQPLDKQPAVVAHNLLWPDVADRNLGDMTKIDWQEAKSKFFPNEDCDLLTYSTPCQSISQSGLQHGFEEGSGTRSSILWYTENAIRSLKPKYLMQENVAAIVSKKFKPTFDAWCKRVEECGYKNYWQLINAKDCGVPQNRNRLIMISIREDVAQNFNFPQPIPLDVVLADLLEEDVDESFYLSDKSVEGYLRTSADFRHNHDFSPKVSNSKA